MEVLIRLLCRLTLVRWSVCLGYTMWAGVRNFVTRCVAELMTRRNGGGAADAPLVSVIVPVGRKDAAYAEMKRSLARQTYRNVELIEIDDSVAHRGAGWARNQGLDKATGKYLLFLDADDFFEPDMISRLVAKAEECDAEIVQCLCDRYEQNWGLYSPMDWVFKRRMFPKQKVFSAHDCAADLYQILPMTLWVKLFRRDFVMKRGVRFQEIPRCNDVYFSLALVSVAEQITILPRVLVHYRHGQTTNLQSGNNETPLSFLRPVAELKKFLMERKIFEQFKVSYLKVSRKIYNHNLALTTGTAHLKVIRAMRWYRVRFMTDGKSIGGGRTYVIQKLREQKWVRNDRKPDFIHVNHLRPLLGLLWCPFYKPRAMVVFVVHGLHLRKYDFLPRTLKNRFARFLRFHLERYLYKRVDIIVALNNDDAAMLKDVYRIKSELVVRPNHVRKIERVEKRAPEYAFVVVGRFDFPKGQDIMVEAIARAQDKLRAQGKRTLFIGDGDTKPEVMELAKAYGVIDLVDFMGEVKFAKNEMWRGKYLVAPSRWEGSPFAVLEAVAQGKFVIASDCPGNRDIIREGVNGTLFPTADIDALAKKLLEVKI